MGINNYFNLGIISWSNTKFSELTSKELYSRQKGEFPIRSWQWKGWVEDCSVSMVLYKSPSDHNENWL